ncbi:class I SAM-dependent methyltransferase [Ramlibacter sp.]|uniref:class I SAM-dependent methyltransferase n=1 Tax=Ramlibacter sp. TaxID=1917967 RepID=UPI002D504D52|nr:class I SAM-dependent methyltransferase [Ramlibacter sp.]HYD74811.1 class I SAM-dependent methyltransferase [Ramlibacter sp.]
MPNPSDVRRVKGTLRHTLDQLLLVDLLRYLVVALRYFWFVKVRRRLATLDAGRGADAAVAGHTVSHNLRGLRDLAVNRSHLLVRPLSVLETLPTDARILSIGPRSEGELLSLAAHGFMWSRIEALDLISYSPKVQLGDMHSTRYPDGSFDAVILGWVLAYSEEPGRAAREIVRITRPGGIIAVGVEYSPLSQEEIVASLGYLPGARKRIASCEEILSFFGDAVDHVYYRHVVASAQRDHQGNFCLLFSVRGPVESTA